MGLEVGQQCVEILKSLKKQLIFLRNIPLIIEFSQTEVFVKFRRKRFIGYSLVRRVQQMSFFVEILSNSERTPHFVVNAVRYVLKIIGLCLSFVDVQALAFRCCNYFSYSFSFYIDLCVLMSLFLLLCCYAFALLCIFCIFLRLFLSKQVSFHYIFPLLYFLIVLVKMLNLRLLLNYFRISRLGYFVNQLGYMHLTKCFPWLKILKKRFFNRLLPSHKNLISPLLYMPLTINIFV